ncbi:MAG: hypothetical protein ACFFA3_08110 [Promethearchaeota archaeon]
MSNIYFSISIIGLVIYLFNSVSVFAYASIIIDRLYIAKKFSKSKNFDLYNDLFSWETFFISIGIVNIIEIFLLLIEFDNILSYLLFKVIILIMFSAFFMKIIHVEKVMRIITYERHYYAGIILFPILFILLIFDISVILLILIFVVTALIPFLVFFSYLRNSEMTIKNSVKICIGAIFLTFGYILTAEYLFDLITLNDSFSILYDIIKIITSVFFLVGSFLIYWSIRMYLTHSTNDHKEDF